MYFLYLLKQYVKNYLLVISSLVFFYVILDLVLNFSKLPTSINLKVLYLYYNSLYSFDIFYSLALIFAILLTIFQMVKKNEMVSLYSLGFSPKLLLKPFLFFAVSIFIAVFLLQFTKYSYSIAYANSILNNSNYETKNIFLKWNDRIIYFNNINPVLKEANGVKIFYLKDGRLYKIISANRAIFIDDRWSLKDAKIEVLNSKKVINYNQNINVLYGFKPKILSNLKQLNAISLYDIYLAIKLFQNINVNSLISLAFYKIFTPLSMIAFLVIIFLNAPLSMRIDNLSLFLVKYSLLSILIWGINLLLYKFAKQGVLSAYLLILPFLIVLLYDFYLIRRSNGF